MKIGIIVHSQTGNTLSVASRLQEKLSAAGHTASIEKIIPDDEKQMDAGRIKLQAIPDLSAFDALVFGAPVHGASVSPAFRAFISQAASLQGKKICCYVTEFFPFGWMGGNRSVGQMKTYCEAKGASVAETGVVNWVNGGRKKMITGIVERFSKVF